MSHYYAESGLLAEKIINTIDTTREEPEYLRSPSDLARYLKSWNIPIDRAPNEEDLAAVLDLRRKLREIYESNDLTASAKMLNAILEGIRVNPQIGVTPQGSIHISWNVESDAPLAIRLAAESALGLSAALEMYGIERFHVCSASPCSEVFIDTTRNQTRRYCCEQCANRHNVAAYRRRKKKTE